MEIKKPTPSPSKEGNIVLLRYFFLGCIFLLVGCSSLKDKTNTQIDLEEAFRDRTEIQTYRQGDIIVTDFPRTPSERPKGVTETYVGKNGATSTKTFDKDGFLERDSIVCPEEFEIRKNDLEYSFKLGLEEKKLTANIELAKIKQETQTMWGNRIALIGLFVSLAWFLRR
ncbi:hypothetical protein [Maribacter flavus]|uniref:Lipoprotein n=1 Tax=Maribacter flavus TaxID=1658664 RepID=A0A5B2TVD2_9FLAO|nr:hypothetical protein [Maribacter flavus]KAA2218264.1 hypothetical protein F0361_01190 [Maribacter flavus]